MTGTVGGVAGPQVNLLLVKMAPSPVLLASREPTTGGRASRALQRSPSVTVSPPERRLCDARTRPTSAASPIVFAGTTSLRRPTMAQISTRRTANGRPIRRTHAIGRASSLGRSSGRKDADAYASTG